CAALPWPDGAAAATGVRATAGDGVLELAFDAALRTRLGTQGRALTAFDASEALLLEGSEADAFPFLEHRVEETSDPRHGAGRRHLVRGRTPDGLEKTVEASFFARYPGMALLQVRYRNAGPQALQVAGWRNAA